MTFFQYLKGIWTLEKGENFYQSPNWFINNSLRRNYLESTFRKKSLKIMCVLSKRTISQHCYSKKKLQIIFSLGILCGYWNVLLQSVYTNPSYKLDLSDFLPNFPSTLNSLKRIKSKSPTLQITNTSHRHPSRTDWISASLTCPSTSIFSS